MKTINLNQVSNEMMTNTLNGIDRCKVIINENLASLEKLRSKFKLYNK
jgi:hypothetical protein